MDRLSPSLVAPRAERVLRPWSEATAAPAEQRIHRPSPQPVYVAPVESRFWRPYALPDALAFPVPTTVVTVTITVDSTAVYADSMDITVDSL